MMSRVCYANVSDLAICQRCPALFGYKVHMHEQDAWREGIKGKGSYYGSMFHKNIACVFFEAAANPYHRLHAELGRAVSGDMETLEEFIREKIFMPFVERFSESYTPEQIMAAAEGVRVWVKAMHEFFREIPSLKKNPLRTMSTIFLAPEQKLQSACDFGGEGKLVVTGKYDALMFNPDKAEARLFEFKGYSKSDAVVPLSQSVMYAWLIERFSGIVPSVEIIYLDEEDRKPDIFSPASVRNMIASGLPGLFYTAFNTIRLRRLPEMVKDKDFCGECRFRNDCLSDWAGKFRKRKGASLVNVIVFMIAAVMITTHVFFFSKLSAENRVLQAESLHMRLQYDNALNNMLDYMRSSDFKDNTSILSSIFEILPEKAVVISSYEDFTKADHSIDVLTDLLGDLIIPNGDGPLIGKKTIGDIHVDIYDLDYAISDGTLILGIGAFDYSGYKYALGLVDKNSTSGLAKAIVPHRVFPPMDDYSSTSSKDITSDIASHIPLLPGIKILILETTKVKYFLIRVYGTDEIYRDRVKNNPKHELMYQVLVRRTASSWELSADSILGTLVDAITDLLNRLDVPQLISLPPTKIDILSFQEVWY